MWLAPRHGLEQRRSGWNAYSGLTAIQCGEMRCYAMHHGFDEGGERALLLFTCWFASGGRSSASIVIINDRLGITAVSSPG